MLMLEVVESPDMLKERDESVDTRAESIIGRSLVSRQADLRSIATPKGDVTIDKDDESVEYQPSKKEVVQTTLRVGVVDRGVTLCGGISYIVVGHRLDQYLAAFKSVRPLLVDVCMLNPRRAYRAFKCYSRLQRLCGRPYLPNLDNARPLEAANLNDYEFVKKVTRYVKVAAAVYGGKVLDQQDVIVFAKEIKCKNGVDRFIRRILPGAVRLDHRSEAFVYRPAWWLYNYPPAKELILAIQGSSSYSDWVTNLVCNPCDIDGVHAGMKQAASRLDGETRATVVKFMKQHADYKLIITGHSLGGGTGTLLGLHWIQTLPDGLGARVRVVSIGSPCIVAQANASLYKDQITSVIFGRDLVARLSYGCVRDLLVTLHGLAKASKVKGLPTIKDIHALDSESPVRVHDPDDDWSVSDGDVENLEELDAMDYKVDDDGIVRPVGALPLFDEIDDGASTVASVESGKTTMSVQMDYGGDPASQSGRQRRQQIRKDILSSFVELPMGFSEMSRLCRTRAAELDQRLNEFRTEPKKKTWWQKLLAIGCCDCCAGMTIAGESLTEIQQSNETIIMNDALSSIMDAAISPEEEMMVPAGRVLFIMPKLHFLECNRPSPALINKGQCILVEIPTEEVVNLVKEPVWNFEAIKDHSINCYLQGLAPELLRALPPHTSVVTAQVAKARAARLNPKIEAMENFQRNLQIRTPALDHSTPKKSTPNTACPDS